VVQGHCRQHQRALRAACSRGFRSSLLWRPRGRPSPGGCCSHSAPPKCARSCARAGVQVYIYVCVCVCARARMFELVPVCVCMGACMLGWTKCRVEVTNTHTLIETCTFCTHHNLSHTHNKLSRCLSLCLCVGRGKAAGGAELSICGGSAGSATVSGEA
jgi:hypothetical protein